MVIQFDEQDVIDAVCVATAERHDADPEDVDVELFHNEHNGFFAQVAIKRIIRRHLYTLDNEDLFEAVRRYLASWHSFDIDRLQVQLEFDQETGVTALIEVLR